MVALLGFLFALLAALSILGGWIWGIMGLINPKKRFQRFGGKRWPGALITIGGGYALAAVFAVLAFIMNVVSAGGPDKFFEAIAEQQRYERQRGFHCLNDFDRLESVENHIRANLHDPRSYEFVENNIYLTMDDVTNAFDLTYRAKNRLGAVVRESVSGKVSNSSCIVVEITTD